MRVFFFFFLKILVFGLAVRCETKVPFLASDHPAELTCQYSGLDVLSTESVLWAGLIVQTVCSSSEENRQTLKPLRKRWVLKENLPSCFLSPLSLSSSISCQEAQRSWCVSFHLLLLFCEKQAEHGRKKCPLSLRSRHEVFTQNCFVQIQDGNWLWEQVKAASSMLCRLQLSEALSCPALFFFLTLLESLCTIHSLE